MLAIAIINHNTAVATIACIEALLADSSMRARLFVLDNGSRAEDAKQLRDFVAAGTADIAFFRSAENRGFAGGANRLIAEALANDDVDLILMLNSDTCPTPGFAARMIERLAPAEFVDLVGARLLDARDGSVDSIGIALYRSTLASNRRHEADVLLGPTGGCALFTRRLLEDLAKTHGEWFDERFFCYAEDTDLVIRARWLGYRPACADDAIVHHSVSLSSGGPDNDFVFYHGIRNSLWWLVKDAPGAWLLRSSPLFLALHAGICLRHLRRGQARLAWRVYRDAWRGLRVMREKRRRIMATRRVPASAFASWITPRFYEQDFLRKAWRELWFGRR